jgi:hypothetical protein
MNPELPFDSIESAHEFFGLLAEALLEAKRDVDTDIQREKVSNVPRRLKALQIVTYKLEALELHLTKSRRILNDLRSLRRLLLEERASSALGVRPKSVGIAKAETSPSLSPEVSRSSVGPESTVATHASACTAVRKRALSSSGGAHAANLDAWYIRREFKSESKASQTGVLCDTKRG